MDVERAVIAGAAGRDFHDFNVVFRGRDDVRVVAFTHAGGQNLGELYELPSRRYPPELAGEGYPDGVPIYPEAELERAVDRHDADTVVFSYSDVSHEDVMHLGSRALAAGADYRLIGPDRMMLDSETPVVAVDAVRTGCGKSQTTRRLVEVFRERGVEPVVVREPMPYGDLVEQRVQRFASLEDVDEADVTIEEREEYEGHVERGTVVYAGVDYEEILREAEREAEVILWDGGNNELPFYRPDLHFVVADPLRPGSELRYHPGEANVRMADVVVVNKVDSAEAEDVDEVVENVRSLNPDVQVLLADSEISFDVESVRGRRALVVEDGPTVTHGHAAYGAGLIAARRAEADVVDPRPHARGSLARVYERYPHLDDVVPALGYSDSQVKDLEDTVRAADVDVVVSATPHDISRVIDVDVPVVRVRYELRERDVTLDDVVAERAGDLGL
ncbi:MAG: GTPase [Halobacteriales archaeon]